LVRTAIKQGAGWEIGLLLLFPRRAKENDLSIVSENETNSACSNGTTRAKTCSVLTPKSLMDNANIAQTIVVSFSGGKLASARSTPSEGAPKISVADGVGGYQTGDWPMVCSVAALKWLE
jgi:hypothetical protein